MKLVVDSSAFAKIYVIEDGSEAVGRLLGNASRLGVCIILPAEILSGMNRRRRENILSERDYRKIKDRLAADVEDATVLQLTPEVMACAFRLLETNTLRAMDALHVACALQWKADFFATADRRQLAAAKNAGLLSEYIGPSDG